MAVPEGNLRKEKLHTDKKDYQCTLLAANPQIAFNLVRAAIVSRNREHINLTGDHLWRSNAKIGSGIS